MIAANRYASPSSTSFTGILLRAVFPVLLFAGLVCFDASAQSSAPQPAPAPAATQEAPEISAHEEMPTFQVKVNLVEVRVVVRDAKGNPIGNLKQEDFQLFDNGKLQKISKFSMEKAGTAPIIHTDNATMPADNAGAPVYHDAAPAITTAVLPQRFIAYLFDDVHLDTGDLAQARNAATTQLKSLKPTERVAVFTTSGLVTLDFSSDRDALIAALARIIPRPIVHTNITECPNVTYYMADLIQNKHDERAIQVATQDALHCAYFDDPQKMAAAEQLAQSTALAILNKGDDETRMSLGVLRGLVRRVAAMPGERTIVLVSPGFLRPDDFAAEVELIEKALATNVIINTLDARGLYTDMPDASDTRPAPSTIAGYMQQFRTQELADDDDILAELAHNTGGTFFHNNNDLGEGFQRLTAQPEYSYLLGFSPQDLKLDGKYHKLKVSLKPPASGGIQARRGYYAPKGMVNASERAKQEIEEAVFSRDELRDIPVEVHTQYFKAGESDAKLSVVIRLDVRHIHFRKSDGRNNDNVTIVSALFDQNGNFVSGDQKVLQLHLKDATLQNRLGAGVTLKSSFDVKPGNYLVRLVVRDDEGQLAAQNSAVEIP